MLFCRFKVKYDEAKVGALVEHVEKGVELGKTLRTDPKLNCIYQDADMSQIKAAYKKLKKAKVWGKVGDEKRKADGGGESGGGEGEAKRAKTDK